MEDQTNLSPWAHPKATKWFETLLERSGLIEEVEEQLHRDDENLELPAGRLLLAILVLLGRPGIWPDRHQRVLAKAANKVNRIVVQNEETSDSERAKKRAPMTLEEHRRSGKADGAMDDEIEIVRRWAGISNRKTEIKQPPTWGDYWG